ncbi:hypothetical protein CPC08DRAFT_751944 [Agrocybe pediades]|nr:hypothetical protein CPC08DRAFT_751944 [Agrocybe pediades]
MTLGPLLCQETSHEGDPPRSAAFPIRMDGIDCLDPVRVRIAASESKKIKYDPKLEGISFVIPLCYETGLEVPSASALIVQWLCFSCAPRQGTRHKEHYTRAWKGDSERTIQVTCLLSGIYQEKGQTRNYIHTRWPVILMQVSWKKKKNLDHESGDRPLGNF